MRKTHRIQPTLQEPWLDMPHAKELRAISRLLEDNRMLGRLVAQDISVGERPSQAGLAGEQALRALIVKQMNGFSYEELAFHIADSQTYRTFCGFGLADRLPKRSTLAENIKRIRASTLEAINQSVVEMARKLGVEKGRKVRVDSTVVESNIHQPSDSALLWDCVRVLTRLMKGARELGVPDLHFPDRTRRAKRRFRNIHHAKTNKQRRGLYRDLVKVTEEVRVTALRVLDQLRAYRPLDLQVVTAIAAVIAQVERYLPLTERVLDQTRRRVFDVEKVPATEKVVSIFEAHTDVIVKAPRETEYGHKIFLTGGASSMILDCVIAAGNPADSTLTETMIDRQAEIYSRPPRQASFDGGFASGPNLHHAKAKGVKDVVFFKRCGLEISEMAKSTWVYRRLRDFRAGIEGCISFLKRIFGLDRCTWRSFPSFESYVWSSIVSFNLLILARHILK
jgi:IS5 family transposase